MKKDKILDLLDGISEDYVNEAAPKAAVRKNVLWARIAAIAACFAVVCTAALLIPLSKKEPPENIPSGDVVSNSAEETGVKTKTDESEINNEPVDTGENTSEIIVSPNEEETSTSAPAIGGTSYCEVHYSAYHMIPGWIIDHIGKDRYEEWIENLEFSDLTLWNSECTRPVNIKTVISEFNITEDEFAKYCNYPSDSVYNLNLLYNGTEEEIDEYYRDLEYFEHEPYRRAHYDNIRETIWFDYEKEIAELGLNQSLYNVFTLSIPEVIYKLDIDLHEFERILKEAEEKCIKTNGVCYTYNYNIEMVYGTDTIQTGTITIEPQTSILSINEDDDPTNDISTNELNEMFCRVGRYAE